ncbi:MAG: uroporphyrinogen-III synthase [Pseudomonadota bacterium]
MKVWVTRPARDAAAYAAGLEALGQTPILQPLFAPDYAGSIGSLYANFDLVIFTSRNGVRGLAARGLAAQFAATPCLTVGAGTADEARAAGFADVRSGPGEAHDLLALVDAIAGEARFAILYARGADVAVDLESPLQDRGHYVESRVVYKMIETGAPDAALSDQIAGRGLGAVALFSPRASERYVAQITARGLTAGAAVYVHDCLSERVAAPLRQLGGLDIAVAAAPNLEEMLALRRRSAAK